MFCYRTLGPHDAGAWQALRIEGARDFPIGCLVTLAETEATSPERCREILDGGTLRGVFDAAALVAFCGYRPHRLARTRHRAEIGPFFVTRSHHGSGAAQALMHGVIEDARGSGIEQLELSVDTLNARAIAFYEGIGFVRVATYPDFVRMDGRPRDEHLYRMRLGR